MSYFFSVTEDNGDLEVTLPSEKKIVLESCNCVRKFFCEHISELNNVFMSSSMDFPDEYGAQPYTLAVCRFFGRYRATDDELGPNGVALLRDLYELLLGSG